jgi:hypothetical protein
MDGLFVCEKIKKAYRIYFYRRDTMRNKQGMMMILTAVLTIIMMFGVCSIDARAAKWGMDVKTVSDYERGGLKDVGVFTDRAGVEYYPCQYAGGKDNCKRLGRIWTNEDGTTGGDPHTHTFILREFICGGEDYELYQCNLNEDIIYYVVMGIDTGEHQYTQTVYPPANGEQGYILYKCSRCGHEYKDYYEGNSPDQGDAGDGTSTDPEAPGDGTDNDTSQTGTQNPTDDPSAPARISLSQAKVSLKKDVFVYDGSFKKPEVTSVVLGKKTLKKNRDYTITYKNNKKKGIGSVIITGCGAYCDTCKKDFRIVGKNSKISYSGDTYVVTGDGTVSFSGTTNKKKTNFKIPVNIKDSRGYSYKVTAISTGALKGNKKATQATLPSGIKLIGAKAFYDCENLKKVTVKSTVITKIGANAFGKCNKKLTFKFPKNKEKAYKKLFGL